MAPRITTVVARSMLVLAGCSSGADARAPRPTPPCTIAEVGGVAITDTDARAISGLLRPPPTPVQARRLAVAAAAAACAVDCSVLVGDDTRYARWLGHYRDAGGGVMAGGANQPMPTGPAPAAIRWARGPNACPGNSLDAGPPAPSQNEGDDDAGA